MISVKDGSFKRFENGAVKLLAKETKWTSLEVRTHSPFFETLISKYDFGPVKLPGLSGNSPQTRESGGNRAYTETINRYAAELGGYLC